MGDDIDLGFDSFEPPVVNEDGPDLSNQFLTNIPESDRGVVAKYIKDWDAGVTKRFQEIHNQYAPFKGVDVNQYQEAMRIYELAANDPMQLYTALDKWVKENAMSDDIDVMDDEEIGEPDDKHTALLRRQVQELTAKLEQKLETDAQEKQLAELDKTMQALHTKHGDFDDEAVLLRMRRGLKPEEAVKDYQKWEENLINTRTQKKAPAFSMLGNNGGSPLGQVDRSKL